MHSQLDVGAWKMFGSLFSNRYNKKREIFYAQYEETRQRYSNLPIYKRPKEPLSRKSPKYSRRKRKPADYDYDEWIAGHFVPIVVRRAIEQWSRRQLMEPVSSLGSDACSWRSWPSGADPAEPRRSLRLADKPNLSLNEIGNPSQRETSDAIKWPQQLSLHEADNKLGSSAQTFIDGCQLHESRLECNMCCKHFGQNCELQLHSLDDCRKYLLATLSN